MILIALGILVQLPLFCGIGLLLPWRPAGRDFSFESLLLCFFSGWGAAAAFLQIWHLVWKIDALAGALLILAAGLGWYRRRREVSAYWRGLNLKSAMRLAVLAMVPALVLANHVMFNEPTVDLGLYHMPTVEWVKQYSIVPGLGNLHHRLAFNNTSLLVAAVLDADFLHLSAYTITNTAVMYVMMLLCGAAIYRLLQRETALNLPDLFYAFMLPVILWQSGAGFIAGYTPDFLIFSLEILLVGEFLRLYIERPEQTGFQTKSAYLVSLVAFGLSVKLSFAGFGVLYLLALFLLQGRMFGFTGKRPMRLWLGWVGLLAIWVLPWVARSVILSGYPFFPSTLLGLDVPWRMPDYLAKPVQGVITGWARTRSQTIAYTADWRWFAAWFERFMYEAKWAFLAGAALAALNTLVGLFVVKRAGNQPFRYEAAGLVTVSVISLAGILYWFILAPDYRFSGALIWIFLISQLLLACCLLWQSGLLPRSLSTTLVLFFLFTLWLSPYQFSRNISPSRLVIPPAMEDVIARFRGDSTLHRQTTQSGLIVNLSAEGEGCWDAPLPCAPYRDFNPKLALFEPGNLQKGFFMEK